MNKPESTSSIKNPWERIYRLPEEYAYYDLLKPHESMDEVIQFFHAKNIKRVLDLGCGIGRNTIPLIYEGFTVIGIDSSSIALCQLQKQLDQLQLNAKLIRGKFQSIPIKNNSVDAVISVQTLNHGTEAEVKKGISEISRVLHPGGLIFITVPGRLAHGKVRHCLVKTATQIETRTFIPTKGNEIGQPHFVYNKTILLKHFNHFKIARIWRDEKDYYCLLGKKL